jgi:hypothetical protein
MINNHEYHKNTPNIISILMRMYQESSEQKQMLLANLMGSAKFTNDYLRPFQSFSDAGINLAALATYPLANALLALFQIAMTLLGGVPLVLELCIYLATIEVRKLSNAFILLIKTTFSLLCATFYAAAIIIETLNILICLLTRSVVTLITALGYPRQESNSGLNESNQSNLLTNTH